MILYLKKKIIKKNIILTDHKLKLLYKIHVYLKNILHKQIIKRNIQNKM